MANQSNTGTVQARRGGCLLYGCLIATVIGIAVSSLVTYLTYRGIRGAMEMYTSAAATPIPTFVSDPALTSKAREKYARLEQALAQPPSTPPTQEEFAFSGKELNSLLYEAFPQAPLKDVVAFDIAEKDAGVQFSVKVFDLQGVWQGLSWFTKGLDARYLNGSARARLQIANGKPEIRLSRLILNGSELPDMALSQADRQLMGFLTSVVEEGNNAIARILPRIRTLTVENGTARIIIDK